MMSKLQPLGNFRRMGLNPSYVTTLVAVCLAFGSAYADVQSDPQPISPDITDIQAGVICPPPITGTVAAPDTVAGTTHVIDIEPSFVAQTHIVPAVIGLGFGVKSRTTQDGGLAGVTMVVTHPPMGPDKTTTQSFTTRINDNSASLSFYQFDYAYELLVGEWEMTAWLDERILYQVNFDVVAPQAAPGLADVCGFADLLS